MWFFRFESLEEYRVDRYFFECQKTRHIRIVSCLDLVILINDLHLRVGVHDNVADPVALVRLRVRNVDSGDPLQGMWPTLL